MVWFQLVQNSTMYVVEDQRGFAIYYLNCDTVQILLQTRDSGISNRTSRCNITLR